MWRCKKCENINSDGADKCFICGYSLSLSMAKEKEKEKEVDYEPVKSVEPMYHETTSLFKENQGEIEAFNREREHELAKKKKLRRFLIPFFIIDAVIIAVIVYLLFDGGIL